MCSHPIAISRHANEPTAESTLPPHLEPCYDRPTGLEGRALAFDFPVGSAIVKTFSYMLDERGRAVRSARS